MTELEKTIKALATAEAKLGEAIEDREDALKALADQKEMLAGHEGDAQRLSKVLERFQADLAEAEKAKKKIAKAHKEALDKHAAALKKLAETKPDSLTPAKLKSEVKGIEDAASALAKLHAEMADYDGAISRLSDLIGPAEAELARKKEVIADGEDRVVEARSESTKAARAVNAAEKDVSDAIKAMSIAMKDCGEKELPKIDPEVIKLLASSGRERRKDFLDIRARSEALDELARAALSKLEEQAEKETPRATLRDALLRNGVATDIAHVTMRLNRVRQSDIRKAVLAATYPVLLRNRVFDADTINEDAAKDKIGLADTLLLDLESEDGPLDRYATILADAAIAELRLDADPGSTSRQLITAQLRASL